MKKRPTVIYFTRSKTHYGYIRAVVRYDGTRLNLNTGLVLSKDQFPYLNSKGFIESDCPTAFDEWGNPDIALTEYSLQEFTRLVFKVANPLADSGKFHTTTSAELAKAIEEERKNEQAHAFDEFDTDPEAWSDKRKGGES